MPAVPAAPGHRIAADRSRPARAVWRDLDRTAGARWIAAVADGSAIALRRSAPFARRRRRRPERPAIARTRRARSNSSPGAAAWPSGPPWSSRLPARLSQLPFLSLPQDERDRRKSGTACPRISFPVESMMSVPLKRQPAIALRQPHLQPDQPVTIQRFRSLRAPRSSADPETRRNRSRSRPRPTRRSARSPPRTRKRCA